MHLQELIEDVRLESTAADLIEVYWFNGEISEEEAKELSYKYGLAFPYFE